MSLSVIIQTKNSVKTLERAIDSVVFADEVVVVDMHSTDGTAELAKRLGAKVFSHDDVGFVEPARQFAIEKASGDWVLVLDADEAISQDLQKKLLRCIQSEQAKTIAAYSLPRKNLMFGHWLMHSGWWPDYQVRLFRRGAVQWPAEIHSVPTVEGEIATLPADPDAAIEHLNYESITAFVQRLDRYTTIQANIDGPLKNAAAHHIVSAFRKELLRRLFAENGTADGMHGIALSLLQAFSEVVRQLKRWELSGSVPKKLTQVDVQALHSLRSELAYWLADAQVEQSRGLRKLWWQLRRKLQL